MRLREFSTRCLVVSENPFFPHFSVSFSRDCTKDRVEPFVHEGRVRIRIPVPRAASDHVE